MWIARDPTRRTVEGMNLLLAATLLVWLFAPLPLAVAVGRAFRAGDDTLLRSAAAGRDAA